MEELAKTIYVGNVGPKVTENDLRSFYIPFGRFKRRFKEHPDCER